MVDLGGSWVVTGSCNQIKERSIVKHLKPTDVAPPPCNGNKLNCQLVMADMSKTCLKEKKSESLKNLLEKPITIKSSCSVNIERSKLPSIDETTTRRNSRKHRECRKVTSEDSTTGKCWLKPGISLPKMHGMEKGDVPTRSPRPPTSSTESWKFDIPTEAVIPPEPSVATPGGCFLSNRVMSEEVSGKVIGPSLCHSSFEVAYSDMTDNLKSFWKLEDGCGEESPALKNWEKWMKIRRRQNAEFAEKLKRDKCKLVMNRGDCVREVMEEKDMLTYARIPESDKWRGHPNRWLEPPALPRKGMKAKYYAYQTLCERGVVPPVELVSVPDAVKEEKGVACHGKGNDRKSEYRTMREEEYSRQLKGVLPHKADTRELIVIGEKIRYDEEKSSPVLYNLPTVAITSPHECPRKMDDDGQTKFGVINLIINRVNLYSDGYNPCKGEVRTIKGGHTWSLIFKEAPVGTITTQILSVENRGTVAVRYKWSNYRPDAYHSSFPPRKTSSSGPCFFFDKNPGVFLPGQKIELSFHHHSMNPGYHTETWCLRFNPDIFAESNSAKVRLVAIADAKATMTDFLKLDAYLDSCVKENVVRDVLWEIFERFKPEIPEDIEYQSLFMEDELFEFQNKSHYYRFDTVEELKSLFTEVQLQPPQQWDFNLFTLEDLIREYAPVKQQKEMMCRLMELSRKLLRPGTSMYKVDKKHKMLYNALCSVVDTIEENAARIRNVFSGLERTDCDVNESYEEGYTRPSSVRSGRSYISSFTSLGASEGGSLDGRSTPDNTVFKVTSKVAVHYRYVLHMMFFSYLCEAVELAAGVIESCKLFEHHGEVVTNENAIFLCDSSV